MYLRKHNNQLITFKTNVTILCYFLNKSNNLNNVTIDCYTTPKLYHVTIRQTMTLLNFVKKYNN